MQTCTTLEWLSADICVYLQSVSRPWCTLAICTSRSLRSSWTFRQACAREFSTARATRHLPFVWYDNSHALEPCKKIISEGIRELNSARAFEVSLSKTEKVPAFWVYKSWLWYVSSQFVRLSTFIRFEKVRERFHKKKFTSKALPNFLKPNKNGAVAWKCTAYLVWWWLMVIFV